MDNSQSPQMDVAYVAKLARLRLEPAEQDRLAGDMGRIVDFIDQLRQLDVDGIEPTAHAAALTNVWSADEDSPSFERGEMLANAPDTIDGELVRVPPVMPGEEGA